MYSMSSFAAAYNTVCDSLCVSSRYRCKAGDWYVFKDARERGDECVEYQISEPGQVPVVCASVPVEGSDASDFILFCRADYPPNP